MDTLIGAVGDVVSKIISFPADVLALAVLIIALFVVVLYIGQKKYTTALFAFYPAAIIYTLFPISLIEAVTIGESALANYVGQLGLFVVLLAAAYVAMQKYMKKRSSESGKKDTLFAFFLGLAGTALILVLCVVLVPISTVYPLSPLITDLVTTDTAAWWMLSPLVILYIFGRD